jgi:hypothetical protein
VLGVGKTVLLMELDLLASEAGWATTDVQEVGSQPDFRSTFARMASRLLHEMSRRHRIRDRIEQALGVVKAFSILAPGGVQLQIGVAAAGTADSGNPEQDLVELLREIGQTAAVAGSGALFLIDEMHNFDAVSLAAVYMAFQAVSRDALPVALVEPAAVLGVDFQEDAAVEVVQLSAAYPYFLQEYGRELWNAAETSHQPIGSFGDE